MIASTSHDDPALQLEYKATMDYLYKDAVAVNPSPGIGLCSILTSASVMATARGISKYVRLLRREYSRKALGVIEC